MTGCFILMSNPIIRGREMCQYGGKCELKKKINSLGFLDIGEGATLKE